MRYPRPIAWGMVEPAVRWLHSDVAKYPPRYDAVIKDLFVKGRPRLLERWLRGRQIRAFLNVEFSIVEERVADLILELDDGSILHIEFQSVNHPAMPYRMGIYAFLIGQKYPGRIIEQTVIYTGSDPMRMEDSLSLGRASIGYTLRDIREYTVDELLESGNPADTALAVLAKGGMDHLRQILAQVHRLPEPDRKQVLTQMSILAGLRGAPERFKMEMDNMGLYITIEDNVILRDIHEQGRQQGMEQGMEQGRHGMAATILRRLAEQRFGPLPAWADACIAAASAAELEQWAGNIFSAPDLGKALGRG